MGAIEDTRMFEAANEDLAIVEAKRLMAQASWEHGSDAYAGNIGICDGVRVHRTAKPVPEKQAIEMAFGRQRPETGEWLARPLAQKWGPAILIRICNQGSRKAKWLLAGVCAS